MFAYASPTSAARVVPSTMVASADPIASASPTQADSNGTSVGEGGAALHACVGPAGSTALEAALGSALCAAPADGSAATAIEEPRASRAASGTSASALDEGLLRRARHLEAWGGRRMLDTLDQGLAGVLVGVVAALWAASGAPPTRTDVADHLRGGPRSTARTGPAPFGHGVLARVPVADIRCALERLTAAGLLAYRANGRLAPTDDGLDLAFGDDTVGLTGVLDSLLAASPADARLLRDLRAWRRERADKAGVPPYRVLTDRALNAVAAASPDTLAGLATIPGIGPATLATHGEALLEVLRAAEATRPGVPARKPAPALRSA